MSSRNSSSSGEFLSSGRYGERMPLRSLNNEILHSSTPSSRGKSKSQHSDAVKTTMGDIPLCDSKPHFHSSPFSKVTQTPADVTQAGPGLEDVTFKSFICAGGEVEIAESSACLAEGGALHDDAATCTDETDDTVIYHSMVEKSCSDHIEHPYYNPKVQESFSVGISAESVCEIPNSTFSFGDVDSKQDEQGLQACVNDRSEEENAPWKSFTCDGGEMEVSEITRLQGETIPLPIADFSDSSQLDVTQSANFSDDCDQLSHLEHVGHPYCLNKSPSLTSFSETAEESEKSANGIGDVIWTPFNCTGGDIEISEGTGLADEIVPLPDTRATWKSHDCSADPSVLTGDEGLQNIIDHSDHPYCNIENISSSCGISTNKESSSCSSETAKVEQMNLMVPEGQDATSESVKEHSIILPEFEKSNGNLDLEKPSPPPQDQSGNCQSVDYSVSTSLTQDHSEPADSHLGKSQVVVDTDNSGSLKTVESDTVKHQMQEMTGNTEHPEDDPLLSVVSKAERSDCSRYASSAEGPVHQEVQECLDNVSQVGSTSGPPESSEAQDSALGSSANGPVPCNSTEKPAELLPDVLKVLSEYPSLASTPQWGILSPIIKRASLPLLKTHGNSLGSRFLANDSALEDDKSLVAPVNELLLADHLESPMPCPLFNSTTVDCKSQPASTAKRDVNLGKKSHAVPQSEGVPVIPESQLQQQLRQMAEFLILASGQMGSSAPPPAVFMAPSHRAPAESHSVCVGTSPVKMADHSINTSGVFVRKREFSVVDCCTVTDPLVWNLPPGSLEGLPRQELEQRLMSSMIMVEALVQQLAAARAQGHPSAGPAPSDLREKLVQTDHTELSQTTMYRELYVEALGRISELELDGSSLQNLIQSMQSTKATVACLISSTDAAFSDMDEWRDIVREDHHVLSSHYKHMMSLVEKSKDKQTRMMQKVKEVLREREDMRAQKEEAFKSKEAAFSTMEQLRIHCASKISALEESVGVQQELLAVLNQTYPEQVELNKACNETLSTASDLLSQTTEEHSSLMNELCTVRGLLQKTTPVLHQLTEKAAAALRERDEHRSARDQAIEERVQIEEELNETHLNLQTARQQIGDLNLQVTILSSEMGVLRQKLTEREEEKGQLERTVTELSATVSSTLASYTFLEQALAAETTKLQQSWKDIQQANMRANELNASLEESEQRVCELSQALAQSEEQVAHLQTLSQSQSAQIQQLQDVCAQLNGVREMNEFLQMENELTREQVVESEQTLRTNLQALRERNIECEDLKGDICKLQVENGTLHEQLETTRSAAEAARMELEEKMAQAVTEITLLHHTLRGLTDELHASLNDQEGGPQKERGSDPSSGVERRHPSCFVDSVMVALTADKEEDGKTDTLSSSDVPESQRQSLFSETSAFTRIVTAKKNVVQAEEEEEEEEEEQSSVSELLSGLGSTIAELVGTINLVQQRKETLIQELHNTICGLQVEQQAASSQHQSEVLELKHHLSRLNNLVERGNQALQQKAQDEKTLTKLMADVQEAQEILLKHKSDNSELRQEVVELRRTLQQSRVESQFLRDELRKTGGQSANSVNYMEEKIRLLKEMERMKASLQEAEQARVKLLDRAKRHQIIYETNIQKSENELQMLNNMINKVRETLLSLPEVVKRCEQLQQLVEFIG